jgi:hypothetical protein
MIISYGVFCMKPTRGLQVPCCSAAKEYPPDKQRVFRYRVESFTDGYGCFGVSGDEGTVGTGVVRITSIGVRSGVLLNMRTTLTRNASRMRTGRIAEAAMVRATGRRLSSIATAISCGLFRTTPREAL